jgi:glutamate N-acetyltransferase/amino-acid N-acetyltransferase
VSARGVGHNRRSATRGKNSADRGIVIDVNPGAASVAGFRFAGVSAGLKTRVGAPDLGLIVADRPATAAAVFTTNQIKAAPVVIAAERVAGGRLRAVVANSGSANCFTGRAGMRLARESTAATARALGCTPALVAPCSTGVIGHLYDLDKFRAGVTEAVAALDSGGMENFARAIMTTDTRPKMASTTIAIGGATVMIAGCAKGAGMIAPNMATMLAFLATDADVPAPLLQRALYRAIPPSFNAITVDGDMSTNDTVMFLASGAAQNRALRGPDLIVFEAATRAVATSLARQLVADGEGATRLVEIVVRNARSASDATRIARQIANSPLVKTAFFGCDPNVGRILAAAGSAGVPIAPEQLELLVDGVKIAARGAILTDALDQAHERMLKREFTVVLDLKSGSGTATVMTCDLSYDYVKINAEYTT